MPGLHVSALMAATLFGTAGCGARSGLTVDEPDAARAADAAVFPAPPLRDLSLRNDTTCAVHYDGRVSCWGLNRSGQLGDGTLEPRSLPVLVAGVTGAVRVITGERTCVVQESGGVACWGAGTSGESGDVGHPPTPVEGFDDAVRVKPGGGLCALTRRANVECVGILDVVEECGDFGCHDVPRTTDTPVAIEGAERVIDFAGVPAWGFCVAREDGTVWCRGVFQVGPAERREDPPIRSIEEWIPVAGIAGAVSVDEDRYGPGMVAVTDDGRAFTWSVAIEETSWPPPERSRLESEPWTPVPAIVEIHGARDRGCARQRDGSVQCWGNGLLGFLGHGRYEVSDAPVRALVESATRMDAFGDRACAATSDGALWCWGDDFWGGLGSGIDIETMRGSRTSATPLRVPGFP